MVVERDNIDDFLGEVNDNFFGVSFKRKFRALLFTCTVLAVLVAIGFLARMALKKMSPEIGFIANSIVKSNVKAVTGVDAINEEKDNPSLITLIKQYMNIVNKEQSDALLESKEAIVLSEKDTSMVSIDNIEAPVWDLSSMYSSMNDPVIFQDLDQAHMIAKEISITYNDADFSNPEVLLSVLPLYERVYIMTSKTSSFAYMNFSINKNDKNILKNKSIIDGKIIEIFSLLEFVGIKLSAIPKDLLVNMINQFPALKAYDYYISRAIQQKAHILSEETEIFATHKSLSSNSAWVRLFDSTLGKTVFNVDENHMGLSLAETLSLLQQSDRKIRLQAASALGMEFNKNVDLYTAILNAIVRDYATDIKLRKYKSPISRMNFYNDVEDSVVDALIESVKENYVATSHRYYALKARLLKLDKLHYADRLAPMPFKPHRKYQWNEAKDIIQKSYRSFSPQMSEITEAFFTENRIHALTVVGKDSGAYCLSSTPSEKPFVMVNYLGRQYDLFTLAHELGHGAHGILSAKQNSLSYHPPLILAETASIFGERLLFDQFMNDSSVSAIEKAALLSERIEHTINSVVRQIAFTDFEKKLHHLSKERDLTSDEISALWLEIQLESLGDTVFTDDGYKNFWVYISHFFHSPFYTYSYAFAELLVDSLFNLYKSGNVANFEQKYMEMLMAGGSQNYKDLLLPFNVDLSKKDFWLGGMNELAHLIDEFEKLVTTKEDVVPSPESAS